MAENNRFSDGMKRQKAKSELTYDAENTKKVEEESKEDFEIIDKLFPDSEKNSNSHAHSLYISDNTWLKLKRISKTKNTSVSAVVQKLLDSVLFPAEQ